MAEIKTASWRQCELLSIRIPKQETSKAWEIIRILILISSSSKGNLSQRLQARRKVCRWWCNQAVPTITMRMKWSSQAVALQPNQATKMPQQARRSRPKSYPRRADSSWEPSAASRRSAKPQRPPAEVTTSRWSNCNQQSRATKKSTAWKWWTAGHSHLIAEWAAVAAAVWRRNSPLRAVLARGEPPRRFRRSEVWKLQQHPTKTISIFFTWAMSIMHPRRPWASETINTQMLPLPLK